VIAVVSIFFSATGTGVDPAPNAKGAPGLELAPAVCPPKAKPGLAKDIDSTVVFDSPNARAGTAPVGLGNDDVLPKANAGV
jgi:hypothetical protein